MMDVRQGHCGDIFSRQFWSVTLSMMIVLIAQMSSLTTTAAQAASPVVTSVSVPAGGQYTTNDDLSFTVNLDQNVLVDTSGGTPYFSLTIGSSTVRASYISGSGTSAIVFRYTVQLGDQDLDGIQLGNTFVLNGGTIENAGGDLANTTLNSIGSTANIFVYTSAPTVLSTIVVGNPGPGSTSVTFEVVFSEAVTGFSLSGLALNTTGTAAATLSNLRTNDNIRYTIDAQNISGAGELRVDVLANAVQNIGGIGNPAFSGGTPWLAGLSSNADLSQLQPSVGALTPAFDPSVLTYAISVPNDVTEIALTPTVSESSATILVNGSTVTSGTAGPSISLSAGSTTISVVVTAQDGTAKTYQVAVIRAASSNADLSGLASNIGTLAPAFSADTLVYSLNVDNAVSSVTLTPSTVDATATVTVNGSAVPSGNASGPIILSVGSTSISIVVTAQDGTTKTYEVRATRAASSAAKLSGLVSSVGTLDPSFGQDTFVYQISVANNVTSISLTPTASDGAASIAVNGSPVVSGSASPVVSLPVGSTMIDVVVTAQDGTTVQTYKVNVVRAASSAAELSGLVSSVGTLDPSFSPATFVYQMSVANDVTSISLTPTASDGAASIAVNGSPVVSGSASPVVSLPVGSTSIDVTVTAQDGTTVQTYKVNVVRAASSAAELSGLVSSAGALDPSFSPATFVYQMSVANDVASISLTPAASDVAAIVKVNGSAVPSGSASGPIALPVGSTTINVVVTAQDGTTIQTYKVTVMRASSAIAELAGLAPNLGTLNPAFGSTTFAYDMKVGNEVESISFTPTASDAGSNITVNGTVVASGAASASLAISEGTNQILVVVTAQDGMTSRTYTVSVARSKPVPTAASRKVEVVAGTTVTVDLTEGASGGPFTTAALRFEPGTSAGSVDIDAENKQLTFDASPTFTGSADVGFTLSNAFGTSAPATITFSVIVRPNPSKDAEVSGLLHAQIDAAKRFAQYQTRNFNSRLEQLHDEGDRRRNSLDIRLGYRQTANRSDSTDAQRRLEEMGGSTNAMTPRPLGYAPDTDALSKTVGGSPSPVPDIQSPDLGRFAIWSGGFVDFAERDKGGLDIGSTAVGMSAGVDYRFSDQFIGGLGIGYGQDKSDVGNNGTASRANAYSAAIYGSYKPIENLFLDGLIGGSWLDFDSRRFVTATDDFASGDRSGRQIFGSLTAAYEFRNTKWLVSPYSRLEISRSWLDGFTEKGGDIYGLTYGDQTVDTIAGVIGIRTSYSFSMDWGILTPGVRAEFTHDFASSSRVNLGYTDIGSLPYAIDTDAVGDDYASLGLSLDAVLSNDWSLGVEYRAALSSGRQDHAIGLKVGARF